MIKQDREMVQAYSALRNDRNFREAPLSHVASPTDKDYELGEIDRYFVQVTNQLNGEIVEVAQQIWKDLQSNPMYRSIELRWKISGPLTDSYDEDGQRVRIGLRAANMTTVRQSAKQMPAIAHQLTNPLQFWRGF